MQKGYIHVYTGNGKGKTTAMLGLALRAAGAGLRIYIGQFIKNSESGEMKAIREKFPDINFEQYGTGLILNRAINKEDIKTAKNGLNKACEAIFSNKYDLVMLDEINVAAHLNLLAVEDIVNIMKQKPENVELVLTGRYAAAEIIEAADLVSEIAEIKHYYKKGIEAREGIEL